MARVRRPGSASGRGAAGRRCARSDNTRSCNGARRRRKGLRARSTTAKGALHLAALRDLARFVAELFAAISYVFDTCRGARTSRHHRCNGTSSSPLSTGCHRPPVLQGRFAFVVAPAGVVLPAGRDPFGYGVARALPRPLLVPDRLAERDCPASRLRSTFSIRARY